MSKLVENILTNNMIESNKLFEERMNNILERKLVEKKKMMQAEGVGGRTIAQAIKDMEAKGLTPRKASDVLGDPRDRPIPPIGAKQKTQVKRKKLEEEALDEAGLAPTKVGKLYRSGVKLGGALGSLYGKYKTAKMILKQRKSDADNWDTKAAGAEPSHSTSEPKKTSILKPQGGPKGAYNVWMQRDKPKSIGGHALSLISKTLSQAGS